MLLSSTMLAGRDLEGYSRLMGTDEVGTLRGLTERRATLIGSSGSIRAV
jgi:hypothetical protein